MRNRPFVFWAGFYYSTFWFDKNNMENTFAQLQLRQTGSGTGVDLDEFSSINRRRILIVEDDPDTALLLKRILILAGFDVSNALVV